MSLSLEDKIEIQELVGRYGNYVDDCDWDKLNEIFTPDAYFEFKGLGIKMNGVEEIVQVLSNLGERASEAHLLTNIYSDKTEEGAKLYFRGIFPYPNPAAEDGTCVIHHASYYDDLVKTDGGWRVKNRIVVIGPRTNPITLED